MGAGELREAQCVVARAWLAGCLRATFGNTADTAGSIATGSRSDTPPRQALAGWGPNDGARPADVSQRSSSRAAIPFPRSCIGRRSQSCAGKARLFLARDADPLPRATAAPRRYQRRARGCLTRKSRAHVATRLGERGPVSGAEPRQYWVLQGIPGNAARIFRKKYASSRYPYAIRFITLILLLMPSSRLVWSG